MPPLKIAHVISFSSEDKVHAANNILDGNIGRKWKCSSPGEKSAVLILQLEKASVISGIDIGNEYSAYIEVLVCRSAGTSPDYKTFLAMTTFMSENESKNGTNINRVRMFKIEDFSKPESNEKWDRVKIVCSQPYNKYVQYGLSFIRFNTYEADTSFNSQKNDKKLGKFILRPESTIDLTDGALLIQKKDQIEKPMTVAQSVRAANSRLLNDQDLSVISSPGLLPPSLKNSASKKKENDSLNTDDIIIKNRNRAELFYTEDEIKPHSKIDKLIEQKQAEQKKMNENATKQSTKKEKNEEKNDEDRKKTRRKTEEEEPPSSSKRKRNSSKDAPKKESSPKKAKATTITKSFNKLLEDVVIVISGIQNPTRANLRSKILEMGGKYKSDWDNTCTHLICAFMNTPKFNQVRGKGKIVTSKWIEECYSERKKIPWRRHALDKQEKNQNESEDEIFEKTDEKNKLLSPKIDTDEDYEETMEQASDTEDKIEKIKNTKNHSPKTEYKMEVQEAPPSSSINDSYSAETESEGETAERKKQLKNKPYDFFRTKKFFLDHNFESDIEEMLKNYIFIHEGFLSEDPTENIDYIICGKDEAKNLNELNSRGVCILPDWVVDCHKCRQFIPPDEYFIL